MRYNNKNFAYGERGQHLTDRELFVPKINPEDRVEQLLIEYRDTPNPSMMMYFYEELEKTWLCPCARENSNAVNFCGNCGVSRQWLIKHTSDHYLARQIVERKGEDVLDWQKLSKQESLRENEKMHSKRNEEKNKSSKHTVRVATRLADYKSRGIRHFIQYMLLYATPRRRFLFLGSVGVLLLTLTTIVLYWMG